MKLTVRVLVLLIVIVLATLAVINNKPLLAAIWGSVVLNIAIVLNEIMKSEP